MSFDRKNDDNRDALRHGPGKRAEQVLTVALIVLLTAYLITFTILNFWGFTEFVTADMYSDTLVARYMWEQKTIFPEGWVFGNQYYVIATPVLSALFYGMTGSMNTAMAMATTVMAALLLLSMYWMLRPFLGRTQLLAALTALVAGVLAIDLRNKVESQIFFVLASYYACYLITLFVVWGDHLRGLFLNKRLLSASFFLGLVLSFCTGMQSVRQTAVMVLPLLMSEGARLLRHWIRARRFPRGTLWLPTVRAGAVTAANIAGLLLMRLLQVPAVTIYGSASLIPPGKLFTQLSTVLLALRRITGFYYANEYGPVWFIVLFSALSVLAVLAALVKIFRTRTWFGGLEAGIVLCWLSILLLLVVGTVFQIFLRSIYLFVWYPLLCFSVAYLIGSARRSGRALVLLLLCVSAAANLYVSYGPALKQTLTGQSTAQTEITDWLKEHEYSLVYGEWLLASIAAAGTDGAVIAGTWYDSTLHILPYINPQDIYTEEDNDRAVYVFTAEEYSEAAVIAEECGAALTLLASFEGGIGIYASSAQLMYPG